MNMSKEKKSKEKIFVEHIENHLKELGIKGDVICKICGKTIDEIYVEYKAHLMRRGNR